MGFHFLPFETTILSRKLVKWHSWLFILLILNYFCFVLTTTTRAEEGNKVLGGSIVLQGSSSTSTVRPWPSHEFLQNVIKTSEQRATNISSPSGPGIVTHSSNPSKALFSSASEPSSPSSVVNITSNTTLPAKNISPKHRSDSTESTRQHSEIAFPPNRGTSLTPEQIKQKVKKVITEIKEDILKEYPTNKTSVIEPGLKVNSEVVINGVKSEKVVNEVSNEKVNSDNASVENGSSEQGNTENVNSEQVNPEKVNVDKVNAEVNSEQVNPENAIIDKANAEVNSEQINPENVSMDKVNVEVNSENEPVTSAEPEVSSSSSGDQNQLQRDYLFLAHSPGDGLNVHAHGLKSTAIQTGQNVTVLIKPPSHRRQENEPQWVYLLAPTTRPQKPPESGHPSISSKGNIPFRVTPIKKTTSDLSPDFYEELVSANRRRIGSFSNHHHYKKRPFRTGLNHDYVDEDQFGWTGEEGEKVFSTFPTKAPQFPHLTWPYTKGSVTTTRKPQTRFPVVKSSDFIHSFPHFSTTPTSYSTTPTPTKIRPITPHPSFEGGIIPIITQSSLPPFLFSTVGPNKVGSVHWGSSGANSYPAVISPTLWTVPPPTSTLKTDIQKNVIPSPSKAPPTTTIKFSADITSTDVSNSGPNILSQIFLTSADKLPSVSPVTNPPLVRKTTPASLSSASADDLPVTAVIKKGGVKAPGNSTKVPTNIWYKPVINHHYGPGNGNGGPSGPGGPLGPQNNNNNSNNNGGGPPFRGPSGPSGPPRGPPPRGPPPRPPTPVTRFPTNDNDETEEESEQRNIVLKVWNYSNGSLELQNEKLIPGRLFEGYQVNDNKVLNMQDLPRSIQRVVEEHISDMNNGSELERIDRHWQQLPMVETDIAGQLKLTRPQPQPLSLNYVLYNQPPLKLKRPHDYLLDTYEQDGFQGQVHSYLQYLLDKDPVKDANWDKVQSYIQEQQSVSQLPFWELDKAPVPSEFPNFEDKDLANLVAVSLILKYLSLDQNRNPMNPFVQTQPTTMHKLGQLFSQEHLNFLFSTPNSIEKLNAAITSATTPITTTRTTTSTTTSTTTTTTTPAPISDEDKVWESIKPVLQQFIRRHKNPSTSAPRLSTTPPVVVSNTKLNVDEQQSSSSSSSSSSTALDKGDLAQYLEDIPDFVTNLAKKKLKKKWNKKLKKFKKKKGGWGWDNFGFNFDFGINFADIIHQKVWTWMKLKYGPLVVLALAMLGPILMLCLPYAMRNYSWYKGGNEDVQHYTYYYPYNHAYPAFDEEYDPYDNGWQGGSRNTNKGGKEIHHHVVVPPNQGHPGQGHPGQGNMPMGGEGYGQGSELNPEISLSPMMQPPPMIQLPPMDHMEPPGMTGDATQQQQFDVPPPGNDADVYMTRLRELGRNLGKVIGTQISGVGQNAAIQMILNSKQDSINQLIQKWFALRNTPLLPKNTDSDEDSWFRRRSPKFRKRKRRSDHVEVLHDHDIW